MTLPPIEISFKPTVYTISYIWISSFIRNNNNNCVKTQFVLLCCTVEPACSCSKKKSCSNTKLSATPPNLKSRGSISCIVKYVIDDYVMRVQATKLTGV